MSTVSLPTGSIEAILERDGSYASVTQGDSMRPLFKTHRDMIVLERCSEPLAKYDVALYRIGEKYILHRVIGFSEKSDSYIIRGDNTFKKEIVPREKVIARLTAFTRRGKHHAVDELGYRIYYTVWNFIYPLRFAFHLMKACAAKIYRKFFKNGK